MSGPNSPEVPRGCVWCIVLGISLLIAFAVVSEVARAWVWIKWAFG